MDITTSLETIIHLIYQGIFYLFIMYIISIVIFLIADNRNPQATFAWMLLFFVFPIGGIIIYFFVGRGRKSFSQQQQLFGEKLWADIQTEIKPLLDRQSKIINNLEQKEKFTYQKKILNLAYHNAHSIVTVHNQLELLQNADQKYPRLMEDLQQAEQFIHLEYYSWNSDEFTEKVKDILLAQVQKGVEVRLIYDRIGTLSISRKYIQDLQAGGVKIYPFSPLTQIHTLGYRNHRKIVIIDGNIGYVGGLNMAQAHLDGGKKFSFWRDTHLRIVGEATISLQAIFASNWYNATQEKLVDAKYFNLEHDSATYSPVQIIASGPDSEWEAIKQLYFLMITAAENYVYIQSPFFIPDLAISEALTTVALSGIDIKIMLTARGPNHSLPYWAANTYIQEMARAGIKIFLYKKGYLHAKTISVDGKFCSIGSTNLDIRSFSINYEVNAVIYDQQLTCQLEQDFLDDLAVCEPFDLETYQNQSFFLKFRDSLARLFSPLM